MQHETVPQQTADGGFPGFAPGEHRELLADINRWRRRQGWTWGHTRGLVNARFTNEATIAVDWLPADENPKGFTVTRRESKYHGWPIPSYYEADSVRQAVDLLVVLRVLPVVFSSAYQLGRSDAGFIAAAETDPGRRCRYCGATSGLKMVRGDVLELTPMQWQCWDGCKDSAR